MRALMSKKICVSVRWVKLWVRPPLWKYVCPFVGLPCGCVPPPCENMCVRSLGYIVGASPPWENMCVRSLGYIVGASPPPVKIRDLFIDEAHTVLGIFPVFFLCMLPTPLCGIFVCRYWPREQKLSKLLLHWNKIFTEIKKPSEFWLQCLFQKGIYVLFLAIRNLYIL